MAFNDLAAPKVKTQYFKIYVQTGTTGSNPETPVYELQGRGVESWSVEQNQEITKTPDVLGYVDMERGVPQPAQSGVQLRLREGSALATLLFDAWCSGDFSALDDVNILQKFEFVTHSEGYAKARLQEHCLIAINSFSGEAGGYLGFDVDIHYSNEITLGKMAVTDPSTIVFTADSSSGNT